MIDAGSALILVGTAIQAVPPIHSLVERARRTRWAREAIQALPFTPVPATSPPDLIELLHRLD